VKTATLAETAFWDSSGVTLLCVHQPSTAIARRIQSKKRRVAFWWGMPLEVRSACRRLVGEGLLLPGDLAAAYRRLSLFSDSGIEIVPSEEVRSLAAAAIDRHGLRAADAMQLGAALVLCRQLPRGRAFVCFDKKLALAADLEGFAVLPPL